MFLLHFSFKALHLLMQSPEEEKSSHGCQSGESVRILVCVLTQRQIIILFAVLYDAFQGTVGRIGIAAPEQQKSGQNAGKSAVAILKGMNSQKGYDKMPMTKRG